MKDELDALHHDVTAATGVALDTFTALEAARAAEQSATQRRADAERVHRDAVAKLTQARATLDARLGLTALASARARLEPPPRAIALQLQQSPAPEVEPAPPEYQDDDDPIR